MQQPEAVRSVALLAAYWPSAEMPDETAVLWAKELRPHDLPDALEAIEILGGARQWMPSLAEFVGIVRECRRDRLAVQTKALPSPNDACSFAEFLNANPEWAERVKALEKPRRPKEERHVIETSLVRLISKGA